jgi:hypothetical protein
VRGIARTPRKSELNYRILSPALALSNQQAKGLVNSLAVPAPLTRPANAAVPPGQVCDAGFCSILASPPGANINTLRDTRDQVLERSEEYRRPSAPRLLMPTVAPPRIAKRPRANPRPFRVSRCEPIFSSGPSRTRTEPFLPNSAASVVFIPFSHLPRRQDHDVTRGLGPVQTRDGLPGTDLRIDVDRDPVTAVVDLYILGLNDQLPPAVLPQEEVVARNDFPSQSFPRSRDHRARRQWP